MRVKTSLGFGIWSLILILFVFLSPFKLQGSKYSNLKISEIRFIFNNFQEIRNKESYRKLLSIKKFENFNLQKIRESISTLYKVGRFSNIEAKFDRISDNSIILYFQCVSRLRLEKIGFNGVFGLKVKDLKRAVRSLRPHNWFDKSNISSAVNEIKSFLSSRGYFSPEVSVKTKKKGFKIHLIFNIKRNNLTRLHKVFLNIKNGFKLPKELKSGLNEKNYIPFKFFRNLEKIREYLKINNFYFPKITTKEVFTDNSKNRVNIYVTIDPGYKYIFRFKGMKNILKVVSDIWGKKVFEKWAERESIEKIRIILKNGGYLNPEVTSYVKLEGNKKYITYDIKKNRRYNLGRVSFTGNKSFSSEILKSVISTDDLIFDKIFFLRKNSIEVDSEVLKWFYYYKGFPLVKIKVGLKFKKSSVDLVFKIDEGEKFLISSLDIVGNKLVDKKTLYDLIKSSEGKPFVQRTLDEDIVNIRNYYFSKGFDNIKLHLDISRGSKKTIRISVNEGKHFSFGSLIIIGASKVQSSLIRRIFSLKEGEDFNRISLEKFQNKIDKNSIFSELSISKLLRKDRIDLLIKVTPNNSKYMGLGVGYEERTGVRLTFEYQRKNIFRSYSTFSALIQLGLNERRGIIVYDTPSIFKGDIDSTLKLWEENEIYRSYKFNRYGISESLVKRLSEYSYILASLSWYRTKLLELDIEESGIDMIGVPFDTTSLNLSYVIDNRDDPFLPTKGEFFSTNIKFAFPLFEKDYSFFRFRWGYQKNVRLFKRGIFSFSIKNGFASGNLSITERFFGGGINTFRGISNDKLGPLDKITGEPSGGNAMLLINMESTFPLYLIPIENLYYSLFFDVGNIYKGVNEFALKNIERALGLGLMIKTSIGLLKFDVAYNFRKRENVSPIVFHIGIGNVF